MQRKDVEISMKSKPNVFIASGKCSVSKKLFGLRLEEKEPQSWSVDWSFPIKEKSAIREGYSNNIIEGEFFFSENYPGCPYCESKNMFLCSCGKIACFNSTKAKVSCPWCNSSGEISGIASSLNGSSDL